MRPLLPKLLLLPLLILPSQVVGQERCPEGRISGIFVDNHAIFDPASIPEEGRIRWVYRLVNRLHMRTREGFIREQLLFEEGDCFDPATVEESARILRDYRFLARADAFGVAQPDGTRHVVVDTRDEWSTELSLSIRFEDEISWEGASLVEQNFLGRGVTLGAIALEREERRELGLTFEVPRIRSSRIDVLGRAKRTRVGSSAAAEIILPFRGESDRAAVRHRLARDRDLYAFVLPDGGPGTVDPELSHLVIPLVTERAEASVARRFGVPGNLLLLGGGLSYERVGTGGPTEVEGVRGSRFSDRDPVGPEAAGHLAPQLGSRQAIRLNLLLGMRQIEFRTRRGLDVLDGTQDLDVGTQALLSLGKSVGSTGAGRRGDLFTRTDLFSGSASERVVTQFFLSSEARWEDSPEERLPRTRDLLVEGLGFVYWTPPTGLQQTVLLRAATHAGWRNTAPFQLTLGGPEGVRGYSELDHPGGRRAVLTLENRIRLASPFPDLADLGLTLFGDLGAIWHGDAPLGADSGWRASLGAGLRFGFPAGSASVIRADLAVPVDGRASGRSPVLRITAGEWMGVLGEFRNLQLARSRWSGIHGEFVGAARRRSFR